LLAIRLCNKIKSPVFSTHRKMPANTNAREKLDGAIAQERQEQRDARQMYEELTARMWAYQTGNGPRPPMRTSSGGASPWSSASR
jgi:hypothetical protein